MTDKQISKLLGLFHEIEELMVNNGAIEKNKDDSPTSFSDKVKSFDNFEKEPDNPGDIGYKFYFKYGTYNIKDMYEDDDEIYEEQEKYEKYKTYKKRYWEYRNTILGGHYYTLKKIGHERNQLLHIYDYKIDNYKKFVRVCNSMISYLKNPTKKPFFGYGKFESEDNNEVNDVYTNQIKSDKLGFKKMSKIIMADKIFDSLINLKTISVFFIALISIDFVEYLMSRGVMPEYKLSDNYIWLMILFVIIYNIKIIFNFIVNTVKRILIFLGDMISELLELIFILFLGLLEMVLPYVFGALAIYGFFTWMSPSKTTQHSNSVEQANTGQSVKKVYTPTETAMKPNVSSAESEKHQTAPVRKIAQHESCMYYYVQTNNLNIRAYASATGHVVGKVHKNDKLCITKEDGDWYYIANDGWVYNKYLSKQKAKKQELKKKKLVKKDVYVWHCSASSTRASGWVERIGKQNAINGALHQCEIRRVTHQSCTIDNCYRVN